MFSKGQMWTAQEGCLEGRPQAGKACQKPLRQRGHHRGAVEGDITHIEGPLSRRGPVTRPLPSQSPLGQVHRQENWGMEMGMAPLTVTPSDPLRGFLLPRPTTLGSSISENDLSA